MNMRQYKNILGLRKSNYNNARLKNGHRISTFVIKLMNRLSMSQVVTWNLNFRSFYKKMRSPKGT